MSSQQTVHPWSVSALLQKAQLYAQEMQTHAREDWQFGLFSTFVLEFLGRAALSKESPVLLADAKDWHNILFATGGVPKAVKYFPKSVETSAVFSRLKEVSVDFTPELEGFALKHVSRRNEELHSGGAPFQELKTNWLASYYETCGVLLKHVEKDLGFIFGDDEAKFADTLIEAHADESAKAVRKAIAAHETVWKGLDQSERDTLCAQASAWATRNLGHRVTCPSCDNDALVSGNPTSVPLKKLSDDLIVETQEHLPAMFECIACKLKISGLSQLSACGLGNTYKSTHTYDAASYYGPADEYEGYEEDNNEW